ncbi:MAG TPA: TonB family protein [Thermoanaerobaculia bacterium]|nr:TonB family protein [Thermoanaerobaculia bacterium]
MTDPRTRHGRGLAIVVLLALIFFTLITLIVVRSGKRAPEAVRETEMLTVLPATLRLRTEPNVRAPVVARAKMGSRLKLLEDRGAWVRVETTDGIAGWAERANLERTSERQRRFARYQIIRHLPPLKGVTTERVQLHSGPGIFYPVIGELEKGASVVVYTRDHDFYAIEHEREIAYAAVDAVDVSAPGTRQLEVQTTMSPEETGTSAPPEVADTAVEPPPIPIPEPERLEPPGGVYTAVPPGGTQPDELDRVLPRYPAAARRASIQGAVVVRGIVRRDGTIDNVEIIKDLPNGLGEAARHAVSRWRFRPATYRGEPIDVYYTVTVNFRLQ